MYKSTIDLKDKLRATLEAKRIARSGIEEAEKKYNELVKQRKKLKSKKEDVRKIDVIIEVLGEELDKLVESSNNAQHGFPIEGGNGFGSGGGAGTDAG